MIVRWRSEPVKPEQLPPDLVWHEEKPHPDYTVTIALTQTREKVAYRRVSFVKGEPCYSKLVFS